MKEYVQPEMEIDLFEDDCGVLTLSSTCSTTGCSINLAHGEGSDPFDSFSWWS